MPAPNTFSPEDLAKRMLHRRAVEAVIWGMPAVNFDLMYQAFSTPGAIGTRSSTGRGLRLEEPDADAEPRHDLSDALHQHEGRAGGARDSARPRADRSPAVSTTPGRRRWKTSARRAWTRARAAST